MKGIVMISSTEADRIIRASASAFIPVIETVELSASAGRILAEDIVAERDQPPFDRVAMDGIALSLQTHHGAVSREVSVLGALRAGAPDIDFRGPVSDGGNERLRGIEVMTGAALPEPWDTVVPVEDFESYVWGAEGRAHLREGVDLRCGSHIHRRASDYRAFQVLVGKGDRISAPHMHVSASNGYTHLKVFKRPRVGIFSTGDELVNVDRAVSDHQIRRSNPAAIAAQLALWGYSLAIDDHLPDDPGLMAAGISKALERCDVVLLSGGVSMGSHDLVPRVLEGLGCEELIHGIAVKPGKPLYFGLASSNKLVFGLPGNPVSALLTFRRFVLPFLPLLEGGRELEAMFLPLAEETRRFNDKTRYSPVLIENEPGKPSRLRLTESTGSGNFFSLLPSDGIAEIAPGDQALAAGTEVAFYPWDRGR